MGTTGGDDRNIETVSAISKLVGAIGALFGLGGISLLYYYIYEAFPDAPTRIGWWATISIGLCIIFFIVYFILKDTLQSMELERRRKLERAPAPGEKGEKS